MKKYLSIFVAVAFVVGLMSPVAPAKAVTSDDLVGWWKLNENANDSSGNDFHGTIHGDTSFVEIDGHEAASFDGSGDYIEIAHDSNLNFTNELTIEGWVRLNSYGVGNQATIAGKWDDLSGNYREYLLTVNTIGQANFYISTTGSNYPKAMWSVPLSLNTWYHLAGTYDSSDIKLYVDGILKATTPWTGNLYGNNEALLIGANDGYGGSERKYTDGYISNVKIWNKALTANDFNDYDGDEVENSIDRCEWTEVDEFTEGPGMNRHWYTSDGFMTLVPGKKGAAPKTVLSDFTIEQTKGCSCEQILNSMSATLQMSFGGHYKFGCSKSVIEAWIAGKYYVGPTYVDEINVSGESNAVVQSNIETKLDTKYFIEASGTYKFVNWTDAGIADASCSLRIPGSFNPNAFIAWIPGSDLPSPYTNYLELWVNGAPFGWGDCNDIDNTYTKEYMGDGLPISFSILDNSYSDNEGSLHVKIIEDKWEDLW